MSILARISLSLPKEMRQLGDMDEGTFYGSELTLRHAN